MPTTRACPDVAEYQRLESGRLSSSEREALLGHLEGCEPCTQRVERLSEQDTLVDLIRQARTLGNPPAGATVARLMARLRELRPTAAEPAKAPARVLLPCSRCGKSLKVNAALAGKKIKCPHCRVVIPVPPFGLAATGEERTVLPATTPELTLGPAGPIRSAGRADETASDQAATPSQVGPKDQHLCDFLAPAQSPDELGRLGPYRILRVLGAGGMGVVFQAEDPQLQRLVALKAMLPGLASSDTAKQRFLREARAAAALKHDHIVTIYQVGEDRDVPFLAMEFLEGEALDERLKRAGRLPLAEVLRIGRETALGLAAAHNRDLIHRDIKPANIWLEARGVVSGGVVSGKEPTHSPLTTHHSPVRVKILDFGLARTSTGEAHLTQAGAIVGTPSYMAPEQAQGKNVGPSCDLFSLGCVLYRMATGELPFRGTDVVSTLIAVATETPKPPHELEAGLPPALSELILRLLAKEPGDRPASAQTVADSLDRIAESSRAGTIQMEAASPVGQTPVGRISQSVQTQPGASATKRLPLPWLAGMAGGVLAAVIAGVVIFWPTPRGLVKIESDDPSVEIVFDKNGPTIKGAGKEPVSLRAGEHGVIVKCGDFTFEADKFVIKKGETITLKVELLPGKIQLVQDGNVLGSVEVPLPKTFTNSLGMEFVLVPKGRSWLGGGGGKFGDQEVEIAQEFYLGKYEVTQDEWDKITGGNPSHFSRTGGGKDAVRDIPDTELRRLPVEMVSWHEAKLFLTLLNARDKQAGWLYRLPKEAEWEYACRGGPMADRFDSAFDYYFDKPSYQLLPDQANFGKGGNGRTCQVGSYKPNRLGLYDMHGNVHEWCEDARGAGGPLHRVFLGAGRVFLGGGYFHPDGCAAADHWVRPASDRVIHLGFRLARVPVGEEPLAPAPSEEKKALSLRPPFKNSLGMDFVLVPKGKSWLGGGSGRIGDKEVEIAHDFYLGKYEVTQEEWEKIMENNPSHFSRTGAGKDAVKDIPDADLKRFPVEMVSWGACREFVDRLNKQVKESGWVYRLPKEAEWEYACRGGPMADRFDSAFDFYFDKPKNHLLPDQANFGKRESGRTCQVGSYKPNRLGLYDMHGNVHEWCEDARGGGGLHRVFLGGGYFHLETCEAWNHLTRPPSDRVAHLGLRLARVPIGKEPLAPAPSGEKKAETLRPPFKNSLGMEFVLVPKGKSWLGGGGGRPGNTEVVLAQDFYLGKYPVTQEEWRNITGTNPSHYSRTGNGKAAVKDVPEDELKRFPVEMVSWDDCQAFVKVVNEKVKESGWVYRMPTEVEWEYACRAGPMANRFESLYHYYFDKPQNELRPDQANFDKREGGRTSRVDFYKPNRLGLYDMHGNVHELCEGVWPHGNDPPGVPNVVLRGGSKYSPPDWCRAALRVRIARPSEDRSNNLGFRLARVPAGKASKAGTTVPPVADAAKKDTARELDKLQGDWLMVAREANGERIPEEKWKGTTSTMTGDNYRIVDGTGVIMEGKIKLDPTKKPKAIDVTITVGGKGAPLGLYLGIYELEDDLLKLCYTRGKERPEDFTTRPRSGHHLAIWKRVKPAQPDGDGFVPLFNGKDLSGWKTHPDAPGDWRVEDGVLVGRGPRKNYLYSERGDYEDFHFRIEAMVNAGGNSGQMFRKKFTAKPSGDGYEVQIDNSKHGAKTGSLFVKGGKPAVLIKEVLVPVDTWFTQEVIARGNHIVVLLNGKKVVDFIDTDRTWRRGHLALQLWEPETIVRFRRIEIKESPAAKTGKDDGWISLTDGGLADWRQDGNDWAVVGGVQLDPKDERRLAVQPGSGILFNTAAGKGAKNLVSRRQFGDVELHAEFMIPRQGNSGVFFLSHYELQIWDSWGVKPARVGDCGGLFPCRLDGAPIAGYGRPPGQNASRPPGEWQTFDAVFRAARFDPAGRLLTPARFERVDHNGLLIHQNADVPSPDPKAAAAPLLLQGGFGAIAFRKVRVRPLTQ